MIEDTMENKILLIGAPTDSIWSICTELSFQKISLSIALTVHEVGGDASKKGRELIHDLQVWVESSPTFSQALQYFPKFEVAQECEFVVWYREETQSLFAVRGGVVGIKRSGKYFEVLSSTNTLQCVQGSLEEGDTLLFGTRLFKDKVLPVLSQSGNPTLAASKYAQDGTTPLEADLCGQITMIAPAQVKSEETPFVVPDPIFSTQSQDQGVVLKSTFQSRGTSSIWFRATPRNKKIVVFVLLLLSLACGLFFLQRFLLGARQRRIDGVTKPLAARFSTITSSSESRMEKEKDLATLLSDTTQAQSSSSQDPAIKRELDVFIEKVKSEYLSVSKRKEIDHLSVFYDFRLISTDFVASQIQYDIPGKLAVFLDTARGKIVSLSIEKKQPQALSLNTDIGKLQSLTIVDRKAYLLGQGGVYEVSLPLDTQGKIVASSSASWQTPKLIGSFAKNLYVFDSTARQIFRYDRDDLGASASAWLRGKEGVDLDVINSLAIDGDVWMGTTKGITYKFTRGDRASFTYKDVVNPPDTTISIYTAELLPNLYILEPRAKRIVIFDKSGTYVSSIISSDLEAATSLVVNEDGTKAYVLAGSLVYEVEL